MVSGDRGRCRRPVNEARARLRVIRAATVLLVLVVAGMVVPVSAASAAPPHQQVQADCGYVTCTLRFDRATTHRQAEGTYVTDVFEVTACPALAIAMGPAGVLPGAACVALAKGVGIVSKEHAKAAEARGDCEGVRIVPVPLVPAPIPGVLPGIVPAPVPIFVKGGTFNCA